MDELGLVGFSDFSDREEERESREEEGLEAVYPRAVCGRDDEDGDRYVLGASTKPIATDRLTESLYHGSGRGAGGGWWSSVIASTPTSIK